MPTDINNALDSVSLIGSPAPILQPMCGRCNNIQQIAGINAIAIYMSETIHHTLMALLYRLPFFSRVGIQTPNMV